jgi:two-component system, response regulator
MAKTTLPIENRNLTHRTILLVEDNRDDEELTIRALRLSNIFNEVVVVHDGEEALDYLWNRGSHADQTREAMPAVVLLDLKLPKLSGHEVLRAMRSDPRTSCVPVVILTSSAQECDISEGYNLGANSYICKPVDFAKFTDAVGHLGLYWVLLNEPPPRVHTEHGVAGAL